MMRGELYSLSKALDINVLAFREHRSKPYFYAPNVDKESFNSEDIAAEKDGIFTNFYPEESWYKKVINSFSDIDIPEFPKPSERSESVKRCIMECASYFGDAGKQPLVKEAYGLDGITYNSIPPKEVLNAGRKYDMSDPSFYLYAAHKKADGAKGECLTLTENGKKLVISMAFLEADMKRCSERLDSSVLYKRARKCAESYFDYYYEGGMDKKEKGAISAAYLNFSSAIFYLFGSNALQDDKFIV